MLKIQPAKVLPMLQGKEAAPLRNFILENPTAQLRVFPVGDKFVSTLVKGDNGRFISASTDTMPQSTQKGALQALAKVFNLVTKQSIH